MISESSNSIVLYRPIGQKEFDLICESGWRSFPPRLYFQPIFYPVLTEDYAIMIARDWNPRDEASGFVGYVTKFAVRADYLAGHEIHTAGGSELLEYWMPADEIEEFNQNIVGTIEVIHEFRPPVADGDLS